MPPQMQLAARFVLDHPSDVALLSMREQARHAGVTPATMTRLAQRLGLSGYDELKDLFANSLRSRADNWGRRAVGLLNREREIGESGLVGEMAQTMANAIGDLASPQTTKALVAGAAVLAKAERIYCVGARGSFPVAFQFAYVQSYFWDRAVLLEGPGATSFDALGHATRRDAMLAVSFNPYARSTVEAVDVAHKRGVAVIAITDSELSPIASGAKATLVVSIRSPSFFDTISPAFAVGEILMALLAVRAGPKVAAAIARREKEYAEAGLFWAGGRRKSAQDRLPRPSRGGAIAAATTPRGRPHVD